MSDQRERAIAKLAEITKTPAYVILAAFDEFGLVAVDPTIAERLGSPDPNVRVDARHELAAEVEEQIGAKP